MKPLGATSETSIGQCPNCRAPINAPVASRRRRLQCPNCREIILLGCATASETSATTPVMPAAPQNDEIAILRARLDELPILRARLDEVATLRARVEVLESAMTGLQQSVMEASRNGKMQWVATAQQPNFSDTQADALRVNLATIPVHRITIEALRGDIRARERAEWFKAVFTEARWSVRGPEDAPISHVRRSGISLATGLPVSPRSAATYLAVRAAGFDITTIFDADLCGDEPRLVVA